MSQKMQQLLDLIVNEEMDKADELFHEIVVEKSREIYENLIAEEAEDDEEDLDEASDEEDEQQDEDIEEGFGDDETSDEIGGDAADDLVGGTVDTDAMGGDAGGDDFGGDGSAPATRDDVQDLEDALAELKAEFEALMGGSDDGADDEFGGEEEGGDEFGGEEGGEDDSEEFGDEEADDEADDEEAEESMGFVREYRETVGNDWQGNNMKTQGKNLGAGTGENYPAPTEGKSPIASGKGKPTTGANAKNILGNSGKGGEGTNTGTSPNADKGQRGLVGGTKGEFTKGVEKNISSSSKSGMKSGSALDKNSAGHGSERKGSGPGPVGAGTGDKAGQTSVGQAKSPLNGAPNRNA